MVYKIITKKAAINVKSLVKTLNRLYINEPFSIRVLSSENNGVIQISYTLWYKKRQKLVSMNRFVDKEIFSSKCQEITKEMNEEFECQVLKCILFSKKTNHLLKDLKGLDLITFADVKEIDLKE